MHYDYVYNGLRLAKLTCSHTYNIDTIKSYINLVNNVYTYKDSCMLFSHIIRCKLCGWSRINQYYNCNGLRLVNAKPQVFRSTRTLRQQQSPAHNTPVPGIATGRSDAKKPQSPTHVGRYLPAHSADRNGGRNN